jgi:protein O-GlcNAc transferase
MRFVFSCGSGGPNYPWADCSLQDGIGGSEECVILLARELAELGHDVTVVNNCREWAREYHGVTYRHYEDTDVHSIPADVLVAWRNWYLLQGSQVGNRWLWCHDQPVGCHCPCREEIDRDDSAFKWLDKVVVLNDWHRALYHIIPDERIFVCQIGIDQRGYQDLDPTVELRDLTRVLYFSHPNRGLDQLRAVWPDVRRAVPSATLAAFWWEPEHFRPPSENIGILPMQRGDPVAMAQETLKAGVFGYPSTFGPEISPATTIKAQAGGCFPVYIEQGGMRDTLKYGRKAQNLHHFKTLLIDTLRDSEQGRLEGQRFEMAAWARDYYSWKTVALKWVEEACR